uniref:Uncharacterized protein n=1 Tax=Lotharella globosa TaxID=91324 RepID=A0A7S3Y7M0_9EUKA
MKRLTREVLVARSGEFTLESIFSLSLRKQGLKLTAALGECKHLKNLDLAENGLKDLRVEGHALPDMKHLKFLDLSQNGLTSADSIPMCERLEILHLEGNRIKNPRDLLKLKTNAPRLKQLFLQAINGTLQNPMCLKSKYAVTVKSMFPSLQVLDGMRLNYHFSLFNLGLKLEEEFQKAAEKDQDLLSGKNEGDVYLIRTHAVSQYNAHACVILGFNQ